MVVILDNIIAYYAEYPAFYDYVNYYSLSEVNHSPDITEQKFSFFAFGDEPIIKILFTNDTFPDQDAIICEIGNFASVFFSFRNSN